MELRNGTLLIVPPACLHMTIDLLPQPPDLRVLVMNLPGTEGGYGSLHVGGVKEGARSALSAQDLVAWTALLGEPPAAVMQRVEQALADGGTWGCERALGHLRILLAAYAEIATGSSRGRRVPGERRVAEAMAFLQTHYYEADMSLPKVAAAVGLSPSHLSSLVRQTTGQSIHQTLVDLRLRRAMALLADTRHTIKEIATLTGWSHQLYFSSAFRKRYGNPPSAYRKTPHTVRSHASPITGGG
jgi:AraC-like DNA-binding protein